MFAPLTVDDLLIISASESRKLADEAERVLLSDPVPTCPEWTVRQLVEHLGGVHRWATMIISEALLQTTGRISCSIRRSHHPATPANCWRGSGRAPMDSSRRCGSHRTTCGPSSFSRTRRRPGLLGAARDPRDHHPPHRRTRGPARPDADDRRGRDPHCRRPGRNRRAGQRFRPAQEQPAAHRRAVPDDDRPDRRRPRPGPSQCRTSHRWSPSASTRTPRRIITGTAAALYLGLWNRGDDIAENGTVDALGHWRDQVRVAWS